MKIVYISSSTIPSKTANSIHVMKMCQAFAQNSHTVTLLTPNRKYDEESNIEDVYKFYGVVPIFDIKKLNFLNIRFIRNFSYALKIFRYIKNIDLVYGRDLLGCFFASFTKPTIFEVHAPFYSKIETIIFKIMLRNRNFKHLVVISNALKEIYISKYKIDPSKIKVAHDGADQVEDFDKKVDLQGDQNSLKIGYVGHLYRGKGIEIIDKIKNRIDKNISLHIVGGLKNDIEYWKKKIDVENVFFYGFITQEKIPFFINSFDIVLLPNQKIVSPYGSKDKKYNISNFTSPLKMFEYMAHGKAIISSDLPVLREVLNNQNSILVDPDNPDKWIEAIEKLKDSKKRELLGDNALKDFEKYSWKNRAKSVINAN